MRLNKAWIVASKDFKIFVKKRTILYSMIWFEIFVSVGLPVLVRFIVGRAANPDVVVVLPGLIDAFSFWFVMGVVILPTGIASYGLVGENIQKSLEPLLATPTTDEEILAGKTIAAFFPAIFSNYIGAALFMLLVNIFTSPTLGYLYFPNKSIAIQLLLLSPMACLLSIGYNVLVSSRSTDIRAAQQTGSLIVLPFGAVYVLSEMGVLPLSTTNMLLMSAVIAVLDIFIFYLVKTAFRREEILTKWK